MSYCVSINNSIGTPPHYSSVYFLQNNEISPVSETVAEQFQSSAMLIHSDEGRRDREVYAENPVIPGSVVNSHMDTSPKDVEAIAFIPPWIISF